MKESVIGSACAYFLKLRVKDIRDESYSNKLVRLVAGLTCICAKAIHFYDKLRL